MAQQLSFLRDAVCDPGGMAAR